jgi:hypothetical protein
MEDFASCLQLGDRKESATICHRKKVQRLVAESGADGDLVTALRAATAQDGCTCLGLHAGEKAVSLGAVTAVGLKGTLRHDKKLLRREQLLLKLLDCCSNL